VGGLLAALGLAGPVFALIQQPTLGWGSPLVIAPLAVGAVLLAGFMAWEQRSASPMLPLALFRRRNFSVGNLQTVAMYAGLAALFFFLAIFLQQVAGYSALEAGLASLPTTAVLFVLSELFGTLADRYGARIFLVAGPLVAAVGMVLLLRVKTPVDYLTDLLPALLVFSVGLSMTVAPLTATVLAGVETSNAGVA
jgi:predicted MFS family arabinose efflux permease